MSLVAATCFQHNPSTQPQAFTVLGHLASDEVDDDTVYQILVAMSTTLAHFSETDNTLLVAMLRCLCRIIPGLLPDSRYATSLFWLGIGVLELGHIPPFAAALELIVVSLRAVSDLGPLVDVLLQARAPAEEPARRLDQFAGVDFDLDPGFSFVAVLYKGIRHPGTRKLAVEAMAALLTDIVKTTPPDISDDAGANGGGAGRLRPRGKVVEDAVGLLVALLPVLAAPPGSSGSTTMAQGGEAVEKVFKGLGIDLRSDLSRLNLLHLLSIP
jgi:neurofibromin 1